MGEINRREFLKNATKGTLGLVALSVLPLGLTACGNKEQKIDTSSMTNLGSLSEIEKGPFPKKVDYVAQIKDAWVTTEQRGFVYVAKDEEKQELLFMSPICTHLGCTAGDANEQQKAEGMTFYCPCHGGQYDELGNNIGGPPPRPLDVFKPIIQDGNVYISVLSPMKRTKKS
ncbi:ubiquinol-cytochrome c reductase iron-sulfur subunit [Schinkia sp. CFF1]